MAVTIHDSREIAPTCAMLVGSMMMPEPIMFTATMNVSCTTFIFFFCSAIPLLLHAVRSFILVRGSFPDHVCMKLDAPVHLLLIHALHLVVEAGEAVERFFERQEIVEHRLRPLIPAFAGNDDADARWIDERQSRRNPAADALGQGHIVHLVRDQRLISVLRGHRELRETARAKRKPL